MLPYSHILAITAGNYGGELGNFHFVTRFWGRIDFL